VYFTTRWGGGVYKWRSSLQLWSASCIAVTTILTLAGEAHGATADEVRTKIAELKAALTAFDGKASIAADINGLRQQLLDKKLIGDGAADAFVQYSSEIQTLTKDTASAQLVRENKAAADSVTALFTALDPLAADMPDILVKARFAAQLNGVTNLISKGRSTQVVLAETLLPAAAGTTPPNEDKAVRTAREAFDTAWTKITEDQSLKIHVIRSWFGDLRTQWREGRLCASTSAIIKKCEATPECSLDALADAPLDKLCGFDPAPLVDPMFKGVATEFTCVHGGKQVFDALAQHPGINPETGAPWDEEDINQAVLHSSAMSFRCPFPAKTTASK